jgi:aminopeptidase N
VSLRDWNDVWLNEGFASYAEWLWQGHVSHDQAWARHHFRNLYRVYSADNPFWKLGPADPGSRRRMFDQRVYDRGAMALQALRMRVGNPAFFRIMRSWAKERAYGAGTTPQFKRLAERVSGRQLDQLFRDWLYRPVKPKGY